MDYFEVPNTSPDSFAFCSDNECPCSETRIPPGGGYMYISQTAVDFRKDARSVSEVESLITAMPAILQQALFSNKNNVTATLMCEQGARKRNLNLEVAAADAKYWWKTGLVPLRATPFADSLELRKESDRLKYGKPSSPEKGPADSPTKRWWEFWK
jgi:hypothetical protein